MKPTRSKDHRLADIVDKGQRIATFLADPAVVNFLDDMEEHAIESLAAASANMGASSDQVRAAAIRYDTVRNLRRYLNGVAGDAVRVLKNMSE